MKTETIKFNTARGETSAYVAMPEETDSGSKAVVQTPILVDYNDGFAAGIGFFGHCDIS